MNLKLFDYHLPKKNIAQIPKKNRSSSKLLIIDRYNDRLIDEKFSNIHNYFNKNDLLIVNDTKVIPARLIGNRKNTKGQVEIFVERIVSEKKILCQLKSTRKIKENDIIIIDNKYELKIIKNNSFCEIDILNSNSQEILDNYGKIPLPPYINRDPLEIDKAGYQTVFAKKKGSVAAPTAGLHFDKKILNKIKNNGINVTHITLHIGMGTFASIKHENIDNHIMHSELYMVPKDTDSLIKEHRKRGGNIIAVGTSTARAIESFYSHNSLSDKMYETNIFIKPGYKFKMIDHLITNFHLPKSSLLIMISAFYNREKILKSYNYAIKNNYKFFSYGDSTLIL